MLAHPMPTPVPRVERPIPVEARSAYIGTVMGCRPGQEPQLKAQVAAGLRAAGLMVEPSMIHASVCSFEIELTSQEADALRRSPQIQHLDPSLPIRTPDPQAQ